MASLKDLINKVKGLFDPTANQGNNFWGSDNPLLKGSVKVQQAIQRAGQSTQKTVSNFANRPAITPQDIGDWFTKGNNDYQNRISYFKNQGLPQRQAVPSAISSFNIGGNPLSSLYQNTIRPTLVNTYNKLNAGNPAPNISSINARNKTALGFIEGNLGQTNPTEYKANIALSNKIKSGQKLSAEEMKKIESLNQQQAIAVGFMGGTVTPTNPMPKLKPSAFVPKKIVQSKGVGVIQGTALNTKIKSKPKTNISLAQEPSPVSASRPSVGLPNFPGNKVGMETQQPQLKANKLASSTNNIPQEGTFYNVDRLNISTKAKGVLKKEIAKSGERVSAVVGKKLTNDEVVQVAENTSGILNRTIGREQTAKKIAENLKLRQEVAAKSQKGFTNKKEAEDFIDLWLKDKSSGTDIARQLQARRIVANQHEQEGIDVILDAIYRNNKNADAILKASKKYDLTNPEQVTAFYREFVKPNAMDWIDAVRYNSMLSSPTTHLVNISSNIQGAGIVEPLTKTVTGGLDAIKSALTGSPRKYYAGEGVEYSKGAVNNLGVASKKLWAVLSGKDTSTMQEIHNIPLTVGGTKLRTVENVLKIPGRLLQGMDEFFTALGEAGNLRSLTYRAGKGVKVTNMGQQAYAQAKKTIFNAPFNPKEEGHLLNAIEFVPKLLAGWKNAENPIVKTIAKFTFPFVKIGSNLLKSGVEYSPVGVGTLWGATNKTEQLAKVVIGTAAALGASTLLGQDRLTWAEPISEKQKNAFRDAGRQPYAVKVGNKWVSYSKLHPALAFNFALIAALDDSIKNSRLSDDQADTIMQTAAKFGKFYADASYLRNIGDFVSAAQGSITGWSKYASNYGQQLIPFRALMGYVERIVDPYQRQVDADGSVLQKQMQYVMAQIPGFASTVPIRTNEMGEPIVNQNRLINAVSPVRITTEDPQASSEFYKIMMESAANKQTIDINNANKRGTTLSSEKAGEISTGIYRLRDGTIKYKDADGTLQKVDSVEQAQEKIALNEFDKSGKNYEVYNDMVFRRDAQGKPSVTPKVKFDYQLGTAQLTQYKANGDIANWIKTAEGQLESIDKQLQDPSIDPLETVSLQNQAHTLIDNIAKYSSYGGFTKPKTSKKKKGVKVSMPKISIAKISMAKSSKAKSPVLKTKKLPSAKTIKAKSLGFKAKKYTTPKSQKFTNTLSNLTKLA